MNDYFNLHFKLQTKISYWRISLSISNPFQDLLLDMKAQKLLTEKYMYWNINAPSEGKHFSWYGNVIIC